MRAMLAVLLLACCAQGAQARAPDQAIPAAAIQVLEEIRGAATARDFETLKRHMLEEFVWSFGGDQNANQAIDAWREDETYLSELIAVLDHGCIYEPPRVRCPGTEELGFRAGLIQVDDTWHFEYFVAGD